MDSVVDVVNEVMDKVMNVATHHASGNAQSRRPSLLRGILLQP